MYPYPWTLHSNVIVENTPTTSSVGGFVIIGGDTKSVNNKLVEYLSTG